LRLSALAGIDRSSPATILMHLGRAVTVDRSLTPDTNHRTGLRGEKPCFERAKESCASGRGVRTAGRGLPASLTREAARRYHSRQ
jgi:hypothetical protein